MTKKVLLTFAVLSLAVASAKTYNVTLYQPSVVGGTELKPGEYKVEVIDQKLRISNGRVSSEAGAKMENVDQKFNSTTVRYINDSVKNKISEIRLGGTKTKVVVD